MKKLVVIVFLAFFSTSGFAQEKRDVYCQLVYHTKFLSKKGSISIDYGEASPLWNEKLREEESERIAILNSLIDALNYMSEKGWTFVNAYPTGAEETVSGKYAYSYRYLLKKEVFIE